MVDAQLDKAVLLKIEEMILQKRREDIVPDHVTFAELDMELKQCLNRLVKGKNLTFGETVNDIYFEISVF